MKKQLVINKIRVPKNDLNSLFLKSLYFSKNPNKDIISYTRLGEKVCTRFSLKKPLLFEQLFYFHDIGYISMITNHGIRLHFKVKNDKIVKLKK